MKQEDWPIEGVMDILNSKISSKDKLRVMASPGVLSGAVIKQWLGISADRPVRIHCLNCGIPEVETWAARWLSGEDRTVKSVEVIELARYSKETSMSWAAIGIWAVLVAWAASTGQVGVTIDAVETWAKVNGPRSDATSTFNRMVTDLIYVLERL